MSNDNTRIYVVTEAAKAGDAPVQHLVQASSQAQAIRHIASPRFAADVASQGDLVRLIGAGVKVQEAAA